MSEPFANYQYQIYLAGLAGTTPAQPVEIDALRKRAREIMTPEACYYDVGGLLTNAGKCRSRVGHDWRSRSRRLSSGTSAT